MRVVLASVSPRRGRSKLAAMDVLVEEYLGRLANVPGKWLDVSTRVFPAEANLAQAASTTKARSRLVLLDSRGRQMSSEKFAAWLAAAREEGVSELWLAIGPADGWSAAARSAATAEISLGAITMGHELARVVLAEQLYRAWAILEGHPYHRGH